MTSELPGNFPTGTPAPESTEWRRFWKIVLHGTILPFLFLLAVLEAVAWYVGETYTPAALVRAMDENPRLIWMVLREQSAARLKLALVAEARPEVLIMGHSRLGKMRSNMFRPYTFFNLARVSWPFNTYAELLRRLPAGYRPKVIIFTVDFCMFSQNYDDHWRELAPVYHWSLPENLIQIHYVATQILQRPRVLLRIDDKGRPARGLSSMIGGDAFQHDGSELTPPVSLFTHNSPESFLQSDWRKNNPGADKMGGNQMAALKEFVDLGRQMGIPMVAVQMPMYGGVVREIEKDPSYGVYQDFYKHVAEGYFDKLGVLFLDYLKFPPYSEDYRYFFDPSHPGNPLTTNVVVAMGSDPRFHALLPRLDVDGLRKQLDADKTAPEHLTLNQ